MHLVGFIIGQKEGEALSVRCATGLTVPHIDTRFLVLWCYLSHQSSLESVVVFVVRWLCYACAATVLLRWDSRNSIYRILLLAKQRGSSARRFCVSWDTWTRAHNLRYQAVPLYSRIYPVKRLLYTGCPRRNVPDFGSVFLMLKYTDITQNTYVQSWTVTEIMAREKCGLLAGARTIPVSWQVLSMFVLECGVRLRKLSSH